MKDVLQTAVSASTFDRSACDIGVVHLGFGAFHRAHQAVYLDALMSQTGDLRWGIGAVNLRAAEADQFAETARDITRNDGYYLKAYAPDGRVDFQHVRSHVAFADWSVDAAKA
ncbi:MAG: mannitol dehydrogenase family protein, partial [Pseudomonadota bacterium]